MNTTFGNRTWAPSIRRKMRGKRSTKVATPELSKGQSVGMTSTATLPLAKTMNQFTREPPHVRCDFAYVEPRKFRKDSFASSESHALPPTAACIIVNGLLMDRTIHPTSLNNAHGLAMFAAVVFNFIVPRLPRPHTSIWL